MISNVAARSNVFIRRSASIASDPDFIRQVRGRVALLHVLDKLSEGDRSINAARRFLTRAQVAEAAWQSPCLRCGAYPEGPVHTSGGVDVVFRCPLGTCTSTDLPPFPVAIDQSLLRALSSTTYRDLSETIRQALNSEVSGERVASPPETVRVTVAIRLTRTQRYLLSDSEIEAALRRFLADENLP